MGGVLGNGKRLGERTDLIGQGGGKRGLELSPSFLPWVATSLAILGWAASFGGQAPRWVSDFEPQLYAYPTPHPLPVLCSQGRPLRLSLENFLSRGARWIGPEASLSAPPPLKPPTSLGIVGARPSGASSAGTFQPVTTNL